MNEAAGVEKMYIDVKDLSTLELDEAQELPEQSFFKNAQGVLFCPFGVEIEQKNKFCDSFKGIRPIRAFNGRLARQMLPAPDPLPSMSQCVYLVVNSGYIFMYLGGGRGYAVNLKEAESLEKDEDDNIITLQFKHAELKLYFGTLAKVCDQWWKILNAICSKLGEDALQKAVQDILPGVYSKSLKFLVTTEYYGSSRVAVRRYPLEEDHGFEKNKNTGPAPNAYQTFFKKSQQFPYASSAAPTSTRPPRRQWSKSASNERSQGIFFARPTPAPVRRQRDAAQESVPFPPPQFDEDAEDSDGQEVSVEPSHVQPLTRQRLASRVPKFDYSKNRRYY